MNKELQNRLETLAMGLIMSAMPGDNPWDKFMELDRDALWPEGFTAWQPFEDWDVHMIQEEVAIGMLSALQDAARLGAEYVNDNNHNNKR